jgi:ribosomal protein S18 acetylase RimI-like enzyme
MFDVRTLRARWIQHLHEPRAVSVVLSPARPDDVPALAALGRDSFIAKFGHLYTAADLAGFLADTHADDTVAARTADPARAYRLARDPGGALLGHVQVSYRCGWPEFARGANAMELKQLYTAPGATGRGIGAALMDWAMADLKAAGADEVQLSVWSGNVDAQRFYARYGFEHVGDTTFPVGEQIDEEFLFAKLI